MKVYRRPHYGVVYTLLLDKVKLLSFKEAHLLIKASFLKFELLTMEYCGVNGSLSAAGRLFSQ